MGQNQDLDIKLNNLASNAQKQQMIDMSQFENLIRETGPDVVYEILNAFKGTLQESVTALQKAESLTNNDLYKVCHKLKGSSLLIGFKALGELCVKAMNDLKENPSGKAESAVQDVLRSTTRIQELVLTNIT